MALGGIGAGFLAGALSTLSPCVLPLLPLVVGGAAAAHRAGPLALAAGLAAAIVFTGGSTPSQPQSPLAAPSSSLRSRQKPRSAHSRAVSTRMSTPSRRRKSSSPVAVTYFISA